MHESHVENTKETFVFEGQEVEKTGRTAIKQLKEINGQKRQLTLVEIRPIDHSIDWKKWVDPTQLYVVQPV